MPPIKPKLILFIGQEPVEYVLDAKRADLPAGRFTERLSVDLSTKKSHQQLRDVLTHYGHSVWEFAPGKSRKRENIIALHTVAVDFDTDADFALIKTTFQNYVHVIYPTVSCTPDNLRFRLLLPLSKPIIDPAKFTAVQKFLLQRFPNTGAIPADERQFSQSQPCFPAAKFNKERKPSWSFANFDQYFVVNSTGTLFEITDDDLCICEPTATRQAQATWVAPIVQPTALDVETYNVLLEWNVRAGTPRHDETDRGRNDLAYKRACLGRKLGHDLETVFAQLQNWNANHCLDESGQSLAPLSESELLATVRSAFTPADAPDHGDNLWPEKAIARKDAQQRLQSSLPSTGESATVEETPLIRIPSEEKYTGNEMCVVDLRVDRLDLAKPADLDKFSHRMMLRTNLIIAAMKSGQPGAQAFIDQLNTTGIAVVCTKRYLHKRQVRLTAAQKDDIVELDTRIFRPHKVADSDLISDFIRCGEDLTFHPHKTELQRIGRLFVKGWVTLLHSREKKGKSTLAFSDVVQVLKTDQSLRVLWISAEDKPGQDDRESRFITGQPFAYRYSRGLQPYSFKQFVGMVYLYRPNVIVIDSLHSFLKPILGDKLPDNSDTPAWQNVIEQFHRVMENMQVSAVLLLDHEAKGSKNKTGTEREKPQAIGSVGKQAAVDGIIAFEAHHHDSTGYAICSWVSRRGMNNVQERFQHKGYEKPTGYEDDRSKWNDLGYSMDVPLPVEPSTSRDTRATAVVAFLKKKGVRAKRYDVATAIGVNPKHHKTLNEIKEMINLTMYRLLEEKVSGEIYWALIDRNSADVEQFLKKKSKSKKDSSNGSES